MIEAGTSKPAPFDIVVVHSFSRFFRDYFELEFYVRKLARNGVRLVSITQEMGDNPMHVMVRQIMAADADHAQALLDSPGQGAISPAIIRGFAQPASASGTGRAVIGGITCARWRSVSRSPTTQSAS